MGLCKCKWAINPLSKGKVEILWKEGSLGGSLHYVLLWTNDRQKHIKMTMELFRKRFTENWSKHIEYLGQPTKIHGQGPNPGRKTMTKIYATYNCRCFVYLFALSISKCLLHLLWKIRFYLGIRHNSHFCNATKYTSNPMRKSKICCLMKQICGTPFEGSKKQLTNQSESRVLVKKLKKSRCWAGQQNHCWAKRIWSRLCYGEG